MEDTNMLPIGTKVIMKEMGQGKTYTITSYDEDMLGFSYVIPPFGGSFTEQSFLVLSIPATSIKK